MKCVASSKFILLFLISVFLMGCVNNQFDFNTYNIDKLSNNTKIEKNKSNNSETELVSKEISEANLPIHCNDGIYNNGEKGLDCGWSCPNQCNFTKKYGGILESDEIWSGNIFVKGAVVVPLGITLKIMPGSVVKFKHDRNYKTYSKGALYSNGGTIKAIGTKEKRIWFTSDAKKPMNGDWQYIMITNSTDSEFDYTIIEFGEGALWQFDSEANISHSIIRWACYDALYAERSTPTIENNLLYSNGYHEIALEQYNNLSILNNVFRHGHFGVHMEETVALVGGNYFHDYNCSCLSAGMNSELTAVGNKFENISNPGLYINVYDGAVFYAKENDYNTSKLPRLNLGFEDIKNFEIDYIPGGVEDKFRYVYEDEDETRIVLKRIGKNLSFGWTLEYVDGFLYRFSQDPRLKGDLNGFIRINPQTQEYKKYDNDKIMNPRGLTWDGEFFYVNDFGLLKIFKFKLENGKVKVYDSFDIPQKENGGTMGLTTDGVYLYLISRDRLKLYKMDKEGNVLDEIFFQTNMQVGNSITWTGNNFWTWGGCNKGLCQWTKDGKLVGEIYQAGKDTWALSWDGQNIWSLQKGSELINDAKISQIKIINSSLS